MLDLTPKGRNEGEGMDWVRHHDRYAQTPRERRNGSRLANKQ
nr:DUF899 family protein [Chelativorans sp. YIM 93263]